MSDPIVHIIIYDEVSCAISAPNSIKNELLELTSYLDPKRFQIASFRNGQWNGKIPVSFHDDTGKYLIAPLSELEKIGHYLHGIDDLDPSDIRVEDKRPPSNIPPDIPLIDENFLIDELGYTLRDYQVRGINNALTKRCGVLSFATNAGKTPICMALCKSLDPYVKTITVVPDAVLAEQTAKTYKKSSLSVGLLLSSVKVKDRKAVVENHRHIVITVKLMMSCIDLFTEEEFAFFLDECHILGESTEIMFREKCGRHSFRLGMSGTVPTESKNPIKRARLFATVGGGIIDTVTAKELEDAGYSSKVTINMVTLEHPKINKMFNGLQAVHQLEYPTETDYYSENPLRRQAIVEYIKSLPKKNTLILCKPALGKQINEFLRSDPSYTYIDQEMKKDGRIKIVSEFATKDDVQICASFGTTATGVSQDRIHRLIMIDVAKDYTAIKQSIGRGTRLDEELPEIEVIDIFSNTYYGAKHKRERMKIYKDEQFEYYSDFLKIVIKE